MLIDIFPRIVTNHNQTVIRRPLVGTGIASNHSQTLMRPFWGTTYQHNQTLVRR